MQTPVLCAIPPTHKKLLLSYFSGADCIPCALTPCRFPLLHSPDTSVIPAVSISRIYICVIALCTTFFRAIYTPHAGIFTDARCSVQKGVEMAIKKRLHICNRSSQLFTLTYYHVYFVFCSPTFYPCFHPHFTLFSLRFYHFQSLLHRIT